MHRYTNALIYESSPYLLQHAHNPVNWYPWGEEALEKARRENKLLLISVGYAACHWCHVMERESFEDKEVAAIMNDRYVCIKVDREERPDIDQIYMNAVQLMTGQGGWPLNCFALPDQRPVYGGTYFPKEDWKSLLLNLDRFYREKPGETEAYAAKLTDGVRRSEKVEVSLERKAFTPADVQEVYEPWKAYFDFRKGGHARAPKFPLPNNFLFLLRYAYHFRDPQAEEIVRLTLDEMARGGIYDQLGGGFCRYSVDAEWHVPHFEKMLYDNGQLVSLYAEAYAWSGEEEYRRVVYETLDFVRRELCAPEGGFFSALDADSEGVEGRFYCWTREEVETCGLGRALGAFCEYYDIRPAGNWEGTNVLRRLYNKEELAGRLGISPAYLEELLEEGRQRLWAAREKRVRPGLDDKILSSWNGIMLKGFLDAYRIFGEESFLETARENATFLKANMVHENGVYRSFKQGRARIDGFLDDYAFLADAFIAMYEASFEEDWLHEARRLADIALRDFWDEGSHMFYYTSSRSEALIDRKHEIMDNVIPSSNSMMARVLYRLGIYFDEGRYSERSLQMLRNVLKPMKGYGSAYSNWAILLQEEVTGLYEVAITGPEAQALRKELDREYIPNKLLSGGTSGSLPVLQGRSGRESMIYVCRNKTCKLPVRTVEEALRQMQSSQAEQAGRA